ncbi:MAG: HIT family protein [Phycisphaerae bacterium]
MRDPNCIFCKIAARDVPASVVYEDDSILALLDVAPLADAHVLVIPREHYAQLTDMPAGACAALAAALPRLGRAVLAVSGAEGFNLLQNNGRAAGQAVDHVHFHLIPRATGDGLGYRWNAGAYPEGRAETLATAYRDALA